MAENDNISINFAEKSSLQKESNHNKNNDNINHDNKTNDDNKTDDNKHKKINGWTLQTQSYFHLCLYRLKYYRIINNFFLFELKKKEGRLSWAIIVISSISSVLSLMNTNEGFFPYWTTIVKWCLVFLTVCTTLISSYIKKQQFIERINNIDRYLQQLNQTVEDLNITFIVEPNKRDSYDDFCKKYIPLIKQLSVSPDAFSPKEWKKTVYAITKYYPELIEGDGTPSELLWPWYKVGLKNENAREESNFKKLILDSYERQHSYIFLNGNFCNNYNNTDNNKDKYKENAVSFMPKMNQFSKEV